jgi:methylaspartate mutase sigma subunit
MTLEPVGAAAADLRREVLLTGLSSDAHTWNLAYLELLLEELGCRVTNLGACVPDAEIIEACRTRRPDLVVISSLNGHGRQDGLRLISALRADPALAELPVVIGGKLDVAGGGPNTAAGLLAAGFDAVFEDGAGLTRFSSFVGALTPRPAAPLAVG